MEDELFLIDKYFVILVLAGTQRYDKNKQIKQSGVAPSADSTQ